MKKLLLLGLLWGAGGLGAQEILENFDRGEPWTVQVVRGKSEGVTVGSALRPGGPGVVEPQRSEGKKQALGIKTYFKVPGIYALRIAAPKPITLGPGARMLGFWVQGENRPHRVLAVLESGGKEQKLPADKLNFMGWKQVWVILPPGESFRFVGWELEWDPLVLGVETQYVYFDDLQVRREP